MLKKKGLLLLAGSLLSVSAWAQEPCGTDVLHRQLKANMPEVAAMEAKLEKEIQQKLRLIDLRQFKTTADTTSYTVPVVVHIVHDYGTEYIADDAVYDAVKDWAEVFLAQNADTASVIAPFKPYIGNARIKLRLATKDPNGNPTKGITRNRTYLTNTAGDEAKLGGWPNNKYINIWFINTFDSDHQGAAAYAYYPSSGAWMPYYDGVISLYTYLNYDKTIPHELGHTLNLAHVWGSNNNAAVACGDDNVDDTPPTKGHLSTGCSAAALYDVTCITGGNIINGVDYPDTVNAQNIMDYTYCAKMFTHGQVERMRAALTSSTAGRNNLWSAANVTATGANSPMPDLAPVPDFSVERAPLATERTYFLCANNSTKFVFRNRSWNDTITDVNWTFSNGADIASTTSLTAVNNQFSQPGWVTVGITATGNNTGSTTMTDDHAVYVADNNMLQPGGYGMNFNSATDHDNWPSFDYYKNGFKWEWYANAGYDGNGCMRFRSFDNRTSPADKVGTPDGDFDDMITPGFDLTGYTGGNLNLNFYTSGAKTNGGQDSMQILISTDCGKIWRRVSSLKGAALINAGVANSEFVPTAATQWKAQTIAIPANYLTASKAFFKFRYFASSKGNDVYFDKFAMTPFTTEVGEVSTTNTMMKVYPNPSNGNVNLTFKTGNDGKVNVTVKDITGKLIYAADEVYPVNTVITKELNDVFPSNGMYMLTVNNATNKITEKVVIVK